MKTKGIILARVSTKEQEKTGLSIEKIQLPQLRDYAKRHNIEVVNEYVFQETAASNKQRKMFNSVIEEIKRKKDIKIIITFRVDRLTRNFKDAVEMEILRKEYNKELHFVSDRLVLKQNSYGKEIQEWDMKVFLAKQHINRCQEDSHNTLKSKLESGEQYGLAPFGYKNVRDINDKASVIVDTFKAGIVKKVFNLYASGVESYLSVAVKLNKDYPDLKLTKRKVEQIIKNPYYIGKRRFKGVLYPHIYEQIIEQEIFDIANSTRKERRHRKKKGKLSGTATYRGLIYCESCGCSFSPSPNVHKYKGAKNLKSDFYYYCTNSKRVHDKKPKGTNDFKLTIEISEIFKKISIPKKELSWIVDSINGSKGAKLDILNKEVAQCKKEITKYENRISNAYEDKLDGSITVQEYDKFKSKYSQIIEQNKIKLERFEIPDESYFCTVEKLLELSSRCSELFLDCEVEEKRQLIGLTLHNLTMNNGKLCYHWRKPFDLIYESCNGHKWGPACDRFRTFFLKNQLVVNT